MPNVGHISPLQTTILTREKVLPFFELQSMLLVKITYMKSKSTATEMRNTQNDSITVETEEIGADIDKKNVDKVQVSQIRSCLVKTPELEAPVETLKEGGVSTMSVIENRTIK